MRACPWQSLQRRGAPYMISQWPIDCCLASHQRVNRNSRKEGTQTLEHLLSAAHTDQPVMSKRQLQRYAHYTSGGRLWSCRLRIALISRLPSKKSLEKTRNRFLDRIAARESL